MITVIFIKNPFEPQKGREVHRFQFEPDTTISYYVTQCTDKLTLSDMVIAKNSYTMGGDKLVRDGDYIVFSPIVAKGGGKNPLLIIATVALSVVAMGAGGAVATALGASSLAAATGFAAIGGYLAAAAVMFIGGTLIQRAFGTAAGNPSLQSGSENPTYSWSGIQTTSGQNNPIPITYGVVRSGGQTIGKYITSDSDKQYLNWLVCAGYGPLTFSDIELNDNPVENYTGTTVVTRPGSNDQDIVPNFNDTISTKSLGYELTESDWRTDVVTGTANRGLILYVECSNGLYYANDKGGLDETFVQIQAQYALDGTDNWVNMLSPHSYLESQIEHIWLNTDAAPIGTYEIKVTWGDSVNRCSVTIGSYTTGMYDVVKGRTRSVGPFNYAEGNESYFAAANNWAKRRLYVRSSRNGTDEGIIRGNKSSAIRREYRVDNLPEGQYKLRVKVIGRGYPVTSTRACTRIWWTAASGIVYDDFSYPGLGLIGIKALATDQISGSPTLKFMKNRSSVYVWNPNTQRYDTQKATNPAWAAYDMIHRAEYIRDARSGDWVYIHHGADADLLLYNQFKEWADYCDAYKLYINIEINTAGELLDIVNKYIAPVGRGMVALFGTKYGCCWDGPKDAVQMFGMGNIITGTFTETFLQTSDRANAVELTFTNAQKDYEQDTVKVFGPTYDTDEYDTTSQLTYYGITDYEQAYREAKFQLYCNAYMVRTVSFQAAIDAIACTVGDVIYVAHDVPEWQVSGRITDVDGQTVTVSALLRNYDSAKSYTFAYRASENDTRYETAITAVTQTDTDATVTLESLPDVPPQPGDIFDIAEVTKGTKRFVVRSISRTDDMIREIEALEYNEDVFREDYTIPPIDYSDAADAANKVQNVTNLTGREAVWVDGGGRTHARIYLSWNYPQGVSYKRFDVFVSRDSGRTYSTLGSAIGLSFEGEVEVGYDYLVKVVTVAALRSSSGVVTQILHGTDVAPDAPTTLNVERMASGVRRYWWDYTYPEPNDIAGFRMKYTQGSVLNWDTGIPVQDGLIVTQPYETQTVRQGTHAVMIKTVDNAGNESPGYAYCILDMGDLLTQNVLYQKAYADNGWADTTHTGYLKQDGSLYPLNSTNRWHTPGQHRWATPDVYEWIDNWQSYTVWTAFTAPASGQFWLTYDITGPAIVYYRTVMDAPVWTGETDAAWGDDDAASFWDDSKMLWKQYSDRLEVSAGDHLEVKVEALNGENETTVVKALTAWIDVPDRNEHFEDLTVPVEGVTLPIVTPHYHTTAVHIDAIQNTTGTGFVQAQIVSRNPCTIKLIDQTGAYVSGTVDVSWQGYIEEVL